VYCSRFCKEHFTSYFERKFKKHLSKNKLLKKKEFLNVQGENKEVVKYLLSDLGRKIDVEFLTKGRKVESFTLDTKAVKQLVAFMRGKKIIISNSFLECFKTNEVKAYAELHNIKIGKPKFKNFEAKLNKLMRDSLKRRPNIYECTYNMMKELKK
jgi:hypothetical protein